tara:strand:- start:140 stop:391 length:252 start_codon:yes stop_codon:yes gene_type:complete
MTLDSALKRDASLHATENHAAQMVAEAYVAFAMRALPAKREHAPMRRMRPILAQMSMMVTEPSMAVDAALALRVLPGFQALAT